MKHIFFLFIAAAAALFCIQGCNGKLQHVDNPAEEQLTKADESGNTCYYILESKAGRAEMQDLKPYNARIILRETEEGVANLAIEYEFLTEFNLIYETENGHHTFSLNLMNVGISKDGHTVLFDTSDLAGTCVVDGLTAEYTNAALKGSLGIEGSDLAIEGMVYGYPFALNIASVTTDQEAFCPRFQDASIIDRLFFVEMEITNMAGDNVDVGIKTILDAESTHFQLASNESCLYRTGLADIFPHGITVEITYDNGMQVVASDRTIGTNQSFAQTATDQRWFLTADINGAIMPVNFTRYIYSINNPQ